MLLCVFWKISWELYGFSTFREHMRFLCSRVLLSELRHGRHHEVALKTTKSGAIFGTRSEVCISEPRLLQLLAPGDVFHTHCELKNNTSSHKTVGAYRSIFQGRCLVFCIVFVVLSLVCIVFLNLCPIPESPQKT